MGHSHKERTINPFSATTHVCLAKPVVSQLRKHMTQKYIADVVNSLLQREGRVYLSGVCCLEVTSSSLMSCAAPAFTCHKNRAWAKICVKQRQWPCFFFQLCTPSSLALGHSILHFLLMWNMGWLLAPLSCACNDSQVIDKVSALKLSRSYRNIAQSLLLWTVPVTLFPTCPVQISKNQGSWRVTGRPLPSSCPEYTKGRNTWRDPSMAPITNEYKSSKH